MPRRSGFGGSRSRAPSRGFGSSPTRSSVPARAPMAAPAHPPAAQSRQPGMFGQMAAMAGGVAVGSAVGHVVGSAMTGGMGGGHQEAAPAPIESGEAPSQYQAEPQQPVCSLEFKQFFECAQTQHDISLCSGFNEALRQCRVDNGIPLQ